MIRKTHFNENHGYSLVLLYGGSPSRTVLDLLPEYKLLPWRFQNTWRGFWNQRKNRIWYMTWLGEQLGYRKLEDWYGIRKRDFDENHGQSLLLQYGSSAILAVKDLFPEHEWLDWRFRNTPHGFWDQRKNRMCYMTWLGKQLGYQKWEDWYSISQKAFINNYGQTLLLRHNSSPARVVMEVYSKYEWLPWLFNRTPIGFWELRKNRIRYMTWLGKRLGFRKKGDWYQLKAKDFYENHGTTLWETQYGSLLAALKDYRPHFKWEMNQYSRTK